jgi:putative alpha-1,2-mannosidase
MLFGCILFFVLKNLFAKDPVEYIQPLLGTGQQGQVFPGVSAPNGMVKFSPDTIHAQGSGYRNYHNTIHGFSITHLSGVFILFYCICGFFFKSGWLYWRFGKFFGLFLF